MKPSDLEAVKIFVNGTRAKILVFSDSHGYTMDMLDCIEEEKPDVLFHLGDMVDDVTDIKSLFPNIPLVNVRGNNDWNVDADDDAIAEVLGTRYFLTHGHLYSVRRSSKTVAMIAKMQGCQVALYGHSHIALLEENVDGVAVANPGSISLPYMSAPSYLRITAERGKKPEMELVYIEKKPRKSRKSFWDKFMNR